jgi:nucleoside phosphorylase
MSSPDAAQKAVIITALPLEFRAVGRHLEKITTDVHPKGTVYETGWLKVGRRKAWKVSVVEIGKGNPRAALETERAIQYLKPHVAIFVGVAGGLKDVALGDVVAATKVYGYESGKVGKEFLPRPEVGNCSYSMEQIARAVVRNGRWQKRLSSRDGVEPNGHVGPIIAGEKVIADSTAELSLFVRRQYSDALAVEMEGIGFLTAGFASASTNLLIVRGISDLLDKKAESDSAGWQPAAAENAAAFACEVLCSIPSERIKYKVTIEDVAEDELPEIIKRIQEAAKDPTITLKATRVNSITLYIEGTRRGYERLRKLAVGDALSGVLRVTAYEVALGHGGLIPEVTRRPERVGREIRRERVSQPEDPERRRGLWAYSELQSLILVTLREHQQYFGSRGMTVTELRSKLSSLVVREVPSETALRKSLVGLVKEDRLVRRTRPSIRSGPPQTFYGLRSTGIVTSTTAAEMLSRLAEGPSRNMSMGQMVDDLYSIALKRGAEREPGSDLFDRVRIEIAFCMELGYLESVPGYPGEVRITSRVKRELEYLRMISTQRRG